MAIVPINGCSFQVILSFNIPVPSDVVPLGPGKCFIICVDGPLPAAHVCESFNGPIPGIMHVTPCLSGIISTISTANTSPGSAPLTYIGLVTGLVLTEFELSN